MYFWYKILTYLFYPFAPIYLQFRKLKKKEDSKRYKEKLSQINKERGGGFLIWIHVASVGEAMSILPVIENCIKEKKIDKILLTSLTLSSGKILEKKYKQDSKVIHQFLPLDIPILTSKFLEHWKPNLSIFIDSEIWPNFILEIKNKKIPLLLVNARITNKTFKRWMLLINFAKQIFGKFDLCIAANNESEHFLKILGAKNIKNYGNLKFSRTKSNASNKLNPFVLEKIKNRRIWCAASTHADEELLSAKSHIKIKKKFNNVLTIIIPRHIDRAKKIELELSSLNLKIERYSKWEQMSDDVDILLIDSYGDAAKFYNISRYVFVGKSLVESLIKDSGQNPIEPARLGCKIFHGPNVSNFVDAYKYLKTLNITEEIKNFDELTQCLIREFEENKSKNDKASTTIENYGQDIFNNVVDEINKYI